MFDSLPLLIGFLLAKDLVRPLPDYLNGNIVDVFPDNRLLISFGAEQGARKGMRPVWVSDPKKRLVGSVELVEVGQTHSIGQFRAPFSPPTSLPRPGDSVTWESLGASQRKWEALKRMRETAPARLPWTAQSWYDGIVIDLTRPK